MKFLFGLAARTHVLRRENARHAGGIILASNHISHFDPLILSAVVRRKIDWMTMAEFFPLPVIGPWLRAVDAFPADRHRANTGTIRTAMDRLRNGGMIGVFPEGGIRDGENSILAGAAVRNGVAALAHMAAVPVLPCVILGSDRLYNKKRWLPGRRAPVWVAFGNPISADPKLPKAAARQLLEQQFTAALNELLAELRHKYSLTETDLPRSPRDRMRE